MTADPGIAADDASRTRAATIALIALITGAAAIGFGPIFVRIADVGPVASAFWRVTLTVPFFWAWVHLAARRRTRSRTARPWLLIACGLFFAADLGLWHWSILLTTIANATLFANLNSVFVVLFGFVLFGERFRRLFLFAMLLALSGAALLVGANIEIAPERLPGDLLGVATAVMYAAYLMSAKRLRVDYSPAEILLYTTVATAAALLPFALLGGEQVLPASAAGWLPLLGLALISQAIGQGLIVYALAHLPAAFSALTLLVQPVVATLMAWYLFSEALGPLQGIGAATILAGILLARLSGRRG